MGEIIGLLLNGIIAEKIGYRKTMIGSLMLVSAFIFIVFFASDLTVLLVGQILLGIPAGSLPDIACVVCSRGLPNPPPRLLDDIRQFVLADEVNSMHRGCCMQCCRERMNGDTEYPSHFSGCGRLL